MSPTLFSGTALDLVTLTTLILGFLATPSLGVLLETPLEAVWLPGSTATSVAAVLALVIATLFSMVFGELLPQFLGISAPLATAKVVAMWPTGLMSEWTPAILPFLAIT